MNPPRFSPGSRRTQGRYARVVACAALGGALLFASVAAAAEPPAAGLRAAVAKIDLTPDQPKKLLGYSARQSTGVLDRIHHRILVLDDGTTRFFLVSSEFCVMSPALYDRVAARLQRDHEVPPANFWWTLTHTHSQKKKKSRAKSKNAKKTFLRNSERSERRRGVAN